MQKLIPVSPPDSAGSYVMAKAIADKSADKLAFVAHIYSFI